MASIILCIYEFYSRIIFVCCTKEMSLYSKQSLFYGLKFCFSTLNKSYFCLLNKQLKILRHKSFLDLPAKVGSSFLTISSVCNVLFYIGVATVTLMPAGYDQGNGGCIAMMYA
uniref:Uncharacterized protein n=1 Tax=Arundo donax TaxID=35708 RepID=A0A0A9DGR1_ARUDO